MAGCLGDVDVPPSAPTLVPVESPTRRVRQTIEGTKQANTSVLNHGEVIVPLDELETWSYEITLEPGENLLDLTCRKESGKESKEHTQATIVFEPDFPAQPGLEPVISPTNVMNQMLNGTKPSQTALVLAELDGQGEVISSGEIVERDAEQEWSHDLQLGGQDQVHFYSLTAVDARGRASEPLDFEIELDRTPPVPVSFYPTDGEGDIPINTLVYLVLDGPISISADSIDPGILVVTDSQGTPVPSSLLYNPLSHSIFMAAMFSPDTAYTVRPNPLLIVDLAGNTAPSGTDWSWSFTTGQENDNSTPSVPTVNDPEGVDPVTRRTTLKSVELSGTKDPLTSIWIGNSEIVALSQSSDWSYSYDLAVGENQIGIMAKSRTGRPSPTVATTIIRDLVRPAPPELDPLPPESVSDPLLTLEGSKQASTSVLYNGRVIVPRSPDSDWVYNADLVPGPNEIELRTRDAQGVLSDPLRLIVDFAQEYEGPVEAGYKLMISFALRDLSRVSPVQSTFDTGANRYSIDAWIEGPLEPGETCVFDSAKKERKNIRYLATLVHYIGSKAGHNNPFWDADYRAPDYLAALVTGGVFDYLGLSEASDRRNDNTGFQSGDLVDATGKIKLTLADLENIDGITEATVTAGLYTIEWVPLDRQLQRIQQGEYLIHILLGLDRDPGWVANNDLETCWGDEGFSTTGQHRIVRRLSLGAVPYSMTIGQTGELAAQDPEQGADQLRYLTSQGITFRWIKTD
jgi:hypothetical protein